MNSLLKESRIRKVRKRKQNPIRQEIYISATDRFYIKEYNGIKVIAKKEDRNHGLND